LTERRRAYKLILGKSKTIGIHQIGSLFSLLPHHFDKAWKLFLQIFFGKNKYFAPWENSFSFGGKKLYS